MNVLHFFGARTNVTGRRGHRGRSGPSRSLLLKAVAVCTVQMLLVWSVAWALPLQDLAPNAGLTEAWETLNLYLLRLNRTLAEGGTLDEARDALEERTFTIADESGRVVATLKLVTTSQGFRLETAGDGAGPDLLVEIVVIGDNLVRVSGQLMTHDAEGNLTGVGSIFTEDGRIVETGVEVLPETLAAIEASLGLGDIFPDGQTLTLAQTLDAVLSAVLPQTVTGPLGIAPEGAPDGQGAGANQAVDEIVELGAGFYERTGDTAAAEILRGLDIFENAIISFIQLFKNGDNGVGVSVGFVVQTVGRLGNAITTQRVTATAIFRGKEMTQFALTQGFESHYGNPDDPTVDPETETRRTALMTTVVDENGVEQQVAALPLLLPANFAADHIQALEGVEGEAQIDGRGLHAAVAATGMFTTGVIRSEDQGEVSVTDQRESFIPTAQGQMFRDQSTGFTLAKSSGSGTNQTAGNAWLDFVGPGQAADGNPDFIIGTNPNGLRIGLKDFETSAGGIISATIVNPDGTDGSRVHFDERAEVFTRGIGGVGPNPSALAGSRFARNADGSVKTLTDSTGAVIGYFVEFLHDTGVADDPETEADESKRYDGVADALIVAKTPVPIFNNANQPIGFDLDGVAEGEIATNHLNGVFVSFADGSVGSPDATFWGNGIGASQIDTNADGVADLNIVVTADGNLEGIEEVLHDTIVLSDGTVLTGSDGVRSVFSTDPIFPDGAQVLTQGEEGSRTQVVVIFSNFETLTPVDRGVRIPVPVELRQPERVSQVAVTMRRDILKAGTSQAALAVAHELMQDDRFIPQALARAAVNDLGGEYGFTEAEFATEMDLYAQNALFAFQVQLNVDGTQNHVFSYSKFEEGNLGALNTENHTIQRQFATQYQQNADGSIVLRDEDPIDRDGDGDPANDELDMRPIPEELVSLGTTVFSHVIEYTEADTVSRRIADPNLRNLSGFLESLMEANDAWADSGMFAEGSLAFALNGEQNALVTTLDHVEGFGATRQLGQPGVHNKTAIVGEHAVDKNGNLHQVRTGSSTVISREENLVVGNHLAVDADQDGDSDWLLPDGTLDTRPEAQGLDTVAEIEVYLAANPDARPVQIGADADGDGTPDFPLARVMKTGEQENAGIALNNFRQEVRDTQDTITKVFQDQLLFQLLNQNVVGEMLQKLGLVTMGRRPVRTAREFRSVDRSAGRGPGTSTMEAYTGVSFLRNEDNTATQGFEVNDFALVNDSVVAERVRRLNVAVQTDESGAIRDGNDPVPGIQAIVSQVTLQDFRNIVDDLGNTVETVGLIGRRGEYAGLLQRGVQVGNQLGLRSTQLRLNPKANNPLEYLGVGGFRGVEAGEIASISGQFNTSDVDGTLVAALSNIQLGFGSSFYIPGAGVVARDNQSVSLGIEFNTVRGRQVASIANVVPFAVRNVYNAIGQLIKIIQAMDWEEVFTRVRDEDGDGVPDN